MMPCSKRIDVAASAQKLPVDNRLSLRIYYRIADNLLRQAAIFRNEKNVIDLYIMLLRFSGLVTETIPRHRDYRASPQSIRDSLKKQFFNALNELEQLKPAVRKRIEELERKHEYEAKPRNQSDNISSVNSFEWPPNNKQPKSNNQLVKVSWPVSNNNGYEEPKRKQLHMLPPKEQIQRLSFTMPRPKDETLSRHSILGPNGLCAQWQPPVRDKGVYYPNNLDMTPIIIPRIQATEDAPPVEKDGSNIASELASLEISIRQDNDGQRLLSTEPSAMISFETSESLDTTIVRQPTPPPVLADVQDLIPIDPAPITELQGLKNEPLPDGLVSPESPMELHISTTMMDSFMRVARSNTVKDLETCGILAGSLKNRKFYVTALIIPKQEGTANSCQATNEEEIFEVQDKRSLFPLGWIHIIGKLYDHKKFAWKTHPTQSCFMSSIDVHTHYSYQVMLPEAVAIVMAPRDNSKKHGIFRLTTPGGMSVIRHCERRGFHSHDPPIDGGPIYKQCTDVYINPDLKFDVIDLRSS